jgi:hypothetical protein
VKLAVVCPEFTVTVAGMVTFALLLPSATAKPEEEAAWLIVTVQDVLPGVFTVVFEHVRPVNCVAAVRLSVAVRLAPL